MITKLMVITVIVYPFDYTDYPVIRLYSGIISLFLIKSVVIFQ